MTEGGVLDVAVLGAGLAGLTAAFHLKDLDLEVIEAAGHIGGRTRSLRLGRSWANFGAQYLSSDKVRMVELADRFGLKLLPIGHLAVFDDMMAGLSPATRATVDRTVARLEQEQARRRPTTAAELDDLSFAEWLGPQSPEAEAWWSFWCESLIGAPIETSLHGAMLAWGDQRTSAFTDEAVPRHDRGDCVFEGGTNELATALAAAIGGRVLLGTKVERVVREGNRYAIEVAEARGRRRIFARRVVSAMPAPIAAATIELPVWKRNALEAVRYGRWIATPILVLPEGAPRRDHPMTHTRQGARYNTNAFALRTPGDIDREGGCFHSYVFDSAARLVWDDPPHTIQSGAVRALLEAFPQYEGRIGYVGFQRWRHALPGYYPGRQKLLPQLQAAVGGLHFCGDYTAFSNTDGAVRSGDRAAVELRAALGAPEPRQG